MSYSAEVLADSPVTYYRLNEGSGSTASDASGHSHSGTYVDTITYGTAPISGLDGTAVTLGTASTQDGRIVATGFAPGTGPFTVEALVKIEYDLSLAFNRLSYVLAEGGTVWEFRFQIIDSGFFGTPQMQFAYGGGANGGHFAYPNDHAWHHVALAFDGASTVKFYLDGALVGTTSHSGWNFDAAHGVCIGGNAGSTSDIFFGSIDEVALYHSCLSGARIVTHFDALSAVPMQNLRTLQRADVPNVLWRLNEASGSTVADDTGNGHSGTISGSPTFNAAQLCANDADSGMGFTSSATVQSNSSFSFASMKSCVLEGVVQVNTLAGSGRAFGFNNVNFSWNGSSGSNALLDFNVTTDDATAITVSLELELGKTYHVSAHYQWDNVTFTTALVTVRSAFIDDVNSVPASGFAEDFTHDAPTGLSISVSDHLVVGGASGQDFIVQDVAFYSSANLETNLGSFDLITTPYVRSIGVLGGDVAALASHGDAVLGVRKHATIVSWSQSSSDFAGVAAGTDQIRAYNPGTFNGNPDYFTVGNAIDTWISNNQASALTFLQYDTSGWSTVPTSATLHLGVGNFFGSSLTLNVAAHDFGPNVDVTNWMNPTALSGLTVIGSQALTVAGDLNISLDPSAINWGGITRLVLFTDIQASGVDPMANQFLEFFVGQVNLRAHQNAVLPSSTNAYPTEVATDSPALYWRMGESSGTTAIDASGNGNDGTYIGATLGHGGLVRGDSNTAVHFSATTALSTGSNVSSNTTFDGEVATIAIEALINLDDLTNYGAIGFEQENTPSTEIDIETDNLGFYTNRIAPGLGGNGQFLVPSATVVAATTYHILAFAQNEPWMKGIYLNGELDLAFELIDSWYTVGKWINTTEKFYSGGDPYHDAANWTVDETALYWTIPSFDRVMIHAVASGAAGPPPPIELFNAVGIHGTATARAALNRIYTVTKPDFCRDPSYHPNGLTIVFAEKIGSQNQLSQINVSGTGHTVLVTGTAPFYDPQWSPDGMFLLFAQQTAVPDGGHPQGQWAIKYRDPSGVVTTIVGDANANMHPVWLTPTQVAFQRLRYGTDSTFHIVLADLAGSVLTDLGVGEYPRLVSV